MKNKSVARVGVRRMATVGPRSAHGRTASDARSAAVLKARDKENARAGVQVTSVIGPPNALCAGVNLVASVKSIGAFSAAIKSSPHRRT